MSSKRIGFVDYRLDNFHANVYLSALARTAIGARIHGCWCDRTGA